MNKVETTLGVILILGLAAYALGYYDGYVRKSQRQ